MRDSDNGVGVNWSQLSFVKLEFELELENFDLELDLLTCVTYNWKMVML